MKVIAKRSEHRFLVELDPHTGEGAIVDTATGRASRVGLVASALMRGYWTDEGVDPRDPEVLGLALDAR